MGNNAIGINMHGGRSIASSSLDDGWPESVEEQGLLLLVWRRNIRNDI